MKTLGCSAEDLSHSTERPKQYMAEISYSFFRWALLGMSLAENRRMEAKLQKELALKKGLIYYLLENYIF